VKIRLTRLASVRKKNGHTFVALEPGRTRIDEMTEDKKKVSGGDRWCRDESSTIEPDNEAFKKLIALH